MGDLSAQSLQREADAALDGAERKRGCLDPVEFRKGRCEAAAVLLQALQSRRTSRLRRASVRWLFARRSRLQVARGDAFGLGVDRAVAATSREVGEASEHRRPGMQLNFLADADAVKEDVGVSSRFGGEVGGVSPRLIVA